MWKVIGYLNTYGVTIRYIVFRVQYIYVCFIYEEVSIEKMYLIYATLLESVCQ